MKEITDSELENIDGGIAPFLITVAASATGAAIVAVIAGWSDFKQGLQDGFWHQQQLAEK